MMHLKEEYLDLLVSVVGAVLPILGDRTQLLLADFTALGLSGFLIEDVSLQSHVSKGRA
jgi:hypothetical protein